MGLLEARGLTVSFPGSSPVVRGVDLDLERGAILGLVGETGAGKTLTVRAILRAIQNAHVSADTIRFDGIDILNASKRQLRTLRGNRIGYVIQDARNALNPMQAVGTSLDHIVRAHQDVGKREARNAILNMFASVGLPDPENVFYRYPHELSGGMAQRVVIAGALISNPDLIIADEATTGLDLTIQAQILDFLLTEIARRNAAAIIVTHDLGIVAHYCTEVAIMYAGKVRERGSVRSVFEAPSHSYTRSLLEASIERVVEPEGEPVSHQRPVNYAAPENKRVLAATHLQKSFRRPGKATVHAVNDVGVDLIVGQTVALVGESGSGKSTVGRCLLRLIDPDSGEIIYDGVDITHEPSRQFRHRRTEIQAVFQDPSSSLDHRMKAIDIVSEPLAIFSKMSRGERRAEGLRLLQSVGLPPEFAERFPRQLSGGQQQRLAIARAVATRPRVIVLDEPTASLDMSVRGQILALFQDLQREYQLSYILISHDLQTVRQFANTLVVMYLGEVVEQGPAEQVFARPRHPYTQALLSAELVADPSVTPKRVVLEGEIPKPTNLPRGCYLASRCPYAVDACRANHPPLATFSEEHFSRCIRPEVT